MFYVWLAVVVIVVAVVCTAVMTVCCMSRRNEQESYDLMTKSKKIEEVLKRR